MKKLFFIFLILFLAVGLGFIIQHDPGYVLLAYDDWRIETSVWVGVILLILSFVLGYFSIRLLKHTSSLSNKWQNWGQGRKQRDALRLTNKGVLEATEGRWAQAETDLIKSAEHSPTPLVNYLTAARAAQQLHAYERRDTYLRTAHHCYQEADIAISLTQAHLQVESQQWEQALATLQHLHRIAPKHNFALKLLHHVYLELKDWPGLLNILPNLRKYKVLPEDEVEIVEKKIYVTLLRKSLDMNNWTDLNKTWDIIPKSWRHNPEIVHLYCQGLIQQQQSVLALPLIEATLKRHWNSQLITLYGIIPPVEKGSKQLSYAERWLSHHPNDPTLLLCLGRLSIREKFWGKAKDYLESCLKITSLPETHQELGRVYEALKEKDIALYHYREALSLSDYGTS